MVRQAHNSQRKQELVRTLKKKKKKMDRALRVCTKGRENLGLEASKEAWWAEWVAEMGEHSRRKRQSGGACIHKHNVME